MSIVVPKGMTFQTFFAEEDGELFFGENDFEVVQTHLDDSKARIKSDSSIQLQRNGDVDGKPKDVKDRLSVNLVITDTAVIIKRAAEKDNNKKLVRVRVRFVLLL
jgi:hypothetical protein